MDSQPSPSPSIQQVTITGRRKLLKPLPRFMNQYRSSRKNLYVVTKTVELLNSPVLRDISSGNASGGVSLPWNPASKGEGKSKYQKQSELVLSLQKGMVMAYKKKLLVFEDDGWGRIEEPFGQTFECMEEEVFIRVRKVALLSRNIRAIMLINIQAMLGDRRALEALMDTLEQEKPLGHLNGPGATILDELARIPEYPHVDAVYLILYLLEAIMVLSDTQHALLAQSMEKRILPYQRELVRSILEPNFKYPWWIPFTLDPQLLALLQDEGVAITYGLLQECGLRMELNNPRSTWDLGAKEPLSALYASLCLLQQLSEA
ncbi:gasdermin-C2-like [Talpa occidentalis]|uniref:gasdermin-C2-like n=1 Tax=Talpa occidentalis TaxID=50954 RepID=UPI00188F73AB|nr:gasdermin-C2-like [Talpa occidentalis]